MSDTNTPGTATIEAGHLHRILTRALPFAGTDKMLPVLCGVHLYAGEGSTLTAEATDRFALAQASGKAEVTDGFSVLVSSADVKRIMDMSKVARGQSAARPITLELAEGTSSHAGALTVRDEWSSSALMVSPFDGQYPNISALVTRAREKGSSAITELHLDPNVFGKLSKALGSKAPYVTFHMPKLDDNGKPGSMLATSPADDEFVAILMPRRPVS